MEKYFKNKYDYEEVEEIFYGDTEDFEIRDIFKLNNIGKVWDGEKANYEIF